MQFEKTDNGLLFGITGHCQSGGWWYFDIWEYDPVKVVRVGKGVVYSSAFDKHHVGRFPLNRALGGGQHIAEMAGVEFVNNGFQYPKEDL